MDAEGIPLEPDKMKEQPLSAKDERSVSPNASKGAGIGHSKDIADQLGPLGSCGDHHLYPSNIYAPQAQAIYYKGFENAPGEWDEYPSYVNAERLDIGSPGIYNDNPSLLFHTGYGYSPQMPYGPYSPVTTPLPSVGQDAQLYSPQQYPFSGPPYYQHLVPPSMQYITPPTPVSQPVLNSVVSIDQQVDGMLLGPRPSYPSPVTSFGRGNFSGNPGGFGFHDLQQGFDAFRTSGLWSDWSKPSDRQRALTPFSPAVSPQPIGNLGSFGQNVGMGSQQPRSFFGFGSGSNSCNRGHLHTDFNQGLSFGSASISSLGTNDRGWLAFDYGRRRGRGDGSLCNCNSALDILSEQNRGPRASKPKSLITNENSASADSNKYSSSTAKTRDESYNCPNFVTEYKDAKFFIIKSYSEDNVHKSIKYGIWASTPNGNRKLDAAYREAKEKNTCPVFLFFSVNASAQFCGVAEMVGPVDFDKSVDYWQQDKWSGQFPVKWHIIRDVPNSQFRHIVLENNDNKPVTNSRDTQEAKLEQGIEMLKIFIQLSLRYSFTYIIMAPAAATASADSVKPRDVCIVGVARTPMGGFLGSLSSLPATKLGSIAIGSALKRAHVDPSLVQEVFFGNVLSANLGQAPARQAALGAGIPNSVVCTTINKVCASGMKATMLAAQSIQLGINDVVVAGGMESMSNVPKYLAEARKGSRLGHDSLVDGMLKDGLWDVYNDYGMGVCAELCAEQHKVTREEQDDYAVQSFERGIAAQDSGAFAWEIVPVEVSGGRGKPSTIVDKDEGLGKFDAGKLRKLRPSFKETGGSVTAGNASSISDGAAALVLVSGETALKLGLHVIGKITGYADAAQAPELFTTAPALAIPKAISNAGLEASQVDYYEINEAFAVVSLSNMKLLGLNPEKVNVHGGAVSLGHPLGCSGARILVTLLGVLKQKNGKYGVGGVCNGGGGASALVVELL